MSFSMQNFQMVNERERKQSHHSISVMSIEILILGQHSSACTAKAYKKSSFERLFEVADIFVLKLTFHQHTILVFDLFPLNHQKTLSFLKISWELEVI